MEPKPKIEKYFNEKYFFTDEQITEIKKLLFATISLYDYYPGRHDYILLCVEKHFKNEDCCRYNEDRTECEIQLNLGSPRGMADLYRECFFIHYNVSKSIFTIKKR